MTAKEKLAALSIADLNTIEDYANHKGEWAPSRSDEETYWYKVAEEAREEFNSRITDIFGPINNG